VKLSTSSLAVLLVLIGWTLMASAQVTGGASSGSATQGTSDVKDLERDFFAAIRSGDAGKFMTYISSGGVNVGPQGDHVSWEQINEQINQQRGLYCKLFDSSCINSELRLDNSDVRDCSYRELLTKNKKVRTASSETTRNGVRQAFLVAEVKDEKCSGVGLVDFIFNLHADGWKLFSIP